MDVAPKPVISPTSLIAQAFNKYRGEFTWTSVFRSLITPFCQRNARGFPPAGPGALIGELALVVAMPRPSTAIALEHSSVIRVARSLFQRVLESDPAAARRLRDEFANRTSQLASEILMAGAKLST